jgi:hypothetical protein
MLKCDYCGRENTPCSTYNPDHKFECAFCRCDRLGIYDALSKEKIIEKLIVAHRELHCMSENSKSAWARVEVAEQKLDKAKEWLKRWLTYGENTFCESEILLNETKSIIGYSL